MKLERISENQIRCTLGKADLADKHLLLNELAYGTDKAKELFREMMMQASNELGFEVDDIPLMIEAIPVSPECLILIITKVEDPEELDTRFSRFSRPSNFHEEDIDDDIDDSLDDFEDESDTIMNVIDNIVDDIEKAKNLAKEQGTDFIPLPKSLQQKAKDTKDKVTKDSDIDIFKVYSFASLNDISDMARLIGDIYTGDNSLYKNPSDNKYYLILSRSDNSNEVFARTCNLISEYGTGVKTTYSTPYHYAEHYKLILKKSALQTLSII